MKCRFMQGACTTLARKPVSHEINFQCDFNLVRNYFSPVPNSANLENISRLKEPRIYMSVAVRMRVGKH